MGDDDNIFAEEMTGVEPLKSEVRVALQKGQIPPLSAAARRAAAVTDGQHLHPLSTAELTLLDPYYPLEFRRDGVQHGVFRKLKQGRYDIEARLDLHKMTVAQAAQQVFNFIREATTLDLRTLMIVHGRGNNSDSGGAVLKTYVNHWLPSLPEVQAFCSAQPQHGGVGAMYVMLRKSERKKQQNRDKFSR